MLKTLEDQTGSNLFFHEEEKILKQTIQEIQDVKKISGFLHKRTSKLIAGLYCRSTLNNLETNLNFNSFLYYRANEKEYKGPFIKINEINAKSIQDGVCLTPPKELLLRLIINYTKAWEEEMLKQSFRTVVLKKRSFITSDNPVCISHQNHLKPGQFECTLPLTPKLGIYSHPKGYFTGLFKTKEYHQRLFNTRTIDGAEKQVFYSSKEDIKFLNEKRKKVDFKYFTEYETHHSQFDDIQFTEYKLKKKQYFCWRYDDVYDDVLLPNSMGTGQKMS